MMKISENGVHRELTPEEEAKWIADAAKAKREQEQPPASPEEVLRLLVAPTINTLALDNNTAIRCTAYHPEWQKLCDEQYTTDQKGYRFQHKGVLYETVQESFSFQSQWEPGTEGTASIFSKVNWQHAGTVDDPIPVPDDVGINAFTYVVGKIYDEDGTLWKCQRQGEADGTEHSFVYKPSQAVGYFVQVQ